MKKNEYSIKEAFQKMFEEYKMQEKITAVKAVSSWGKVMGPCIEKYTEKISVKNRNLHIKLSSSALKQELSFGKQHIISLINQELNEDFIQEVYLT
ncbi:MAG: DUF721 domain-containing protein [Flavobacteriales bacterium AspAUS03]